MSARKHNVDCTEDIGRFVSGFNAAQPPVPTKSVKAWLGGADSHVWRDLLRSREESKRGKK